MRQAHACRLHHAASTLQPLEPRLLLSTTPVISEFMAVNDSTLMDEDGEFSDWIEVHNPTAAAVDLTGWFLTDKDDDLTQWALPGVTLDPDEHIVIFASNKDRNDPASELHTNFRLDGDGEFVALVQPDGATVVSSYAPYPLQAPDVSYGLFDPGGGLIEQYFDTPTPGDANVEGLVGLLESPVFTFNAGFYDGPFELELFGPPGAEVRYTTNGDAPTASSTLAAGPFTIDSTTTIRAASFRTGYLASPMVTQTYIFLDDVILQDASGLQPVADWGHLGPDWEMDPAVVAAHQTTIRDDLLSVPSVSLSMPWDDWFGGSGHGIYIQGDGIERAASMEWINPDTTPGFAINAAVQIQGGSSTDRWKTDKLSLRVKFQEPYGPSELDFDVFDGGAAVDEFDTLILDSVLNYSWLHNFSPVQRENAKYIQDQFVADLQNAMGGAAPHGRYVHLYLNGLYWGMYYLHERPDESFAAAYLGGDADEYDVIKHNDNGLVNGTTAAYDDLLVRARKNLANDANYQDVLDVLDADAFIDYMLVNFYAGNTDWAHHNWYASYNRVDPDGRWRFHSWDAEHVLKGVNDNVTGKDDTDGPTEIHQNLLANADYRLRFADHVHRHMFNDGVLTAGRAAATYQQRMSEVDRAIIGESARWGDNREPTAFTRDDWLDTQNGLLTDYFPQRTQIVFNQLKDDGLYPDVNAPTFNQHGGTIAPSFELSIANPGGAGGVYYTLNGGDPRAADGAVAPGAILYDGAPVALQQDALVSARVLDGGDWSALNQAAFELAPSLLITEFMADNETTLADEDGEFSDWIELRNVSAEPIDIGGWHLTDDDDDLTQWTLPSITLQPGEFLLVFASNKDRSIAGFELHANFALSNNGEYLALVRPDGVTIEQAFDPFPAQDDDVSYGIAQDETTLLGSPAAVKYLVPTPGDAGLGTTWTEKDFNDASFSGTVAASSSTVVITEAATGLPDFFELQNVSDATVDTLGWVVAVSQSNTNINAVNSTPAQLPTQLSAGQVHFFSDDGGDPPGSVWGSNINWQTNGNGWILLLDDNGDVVDFVVWGFDATAIASFNVTVFGTNVTAADVPWSGAGAAAGGTSSNSLKRTGGEDHDDASDFAFTAPQSKGQANAGLNTPFPDGQAPALTGIGFNRNHAASGFEVTLFKSTGAINNLDEAEAVIATPGLQAAVMTQRYDAINFFNTGAAAHYGDDHGLPGHAIGDNVDDYVTLSTGRVYIPRTGNWTFGVNSDDGFALDITGHGEAFHIEFDGLRGASDTLGVFNADAPGWYDVRLVQFDHLGGSSFEFFAAEGSHAGFNASAFDLVGDAAGGGLEIGGIGGLINADVGDAMHGVNASLWTRIEFDADNPAAFDSLALHMKYADGFVAYLNGTEVARQNAPASVQFDSAATATRSPDDAGEFEIIEISASLHLLLAGSNVLAIHGLNDAAGNDAFLVLPQLRGASNSQVQRFFLTATPGAPNSGAFVAFVEDTQFSHKRGFYDSPFSLEITTDTPDATIRYTIDGTPPTETNGITYTGPIAIAQTTVLRAAAFKDGFEPTNIDTQTYFFLSDIVTQSADGSAPPGFPSGSVNGQVFNYGMDPDITGDPTWGPQMQAALTAIPAMSIVTDTAHLFDPSTGIYVNAGQHGSAWERPISLEYILPDGSDGFQVEAGLRIRGGFSRSGGNPKHALRLFFRADYGDAKLNYALFGDEGVDEFDVLDLRTSQNYSWSFQGDGRNNMLRDIFARDSAAAMGQPYTRGDYLHLYINGQYWGIYQTEERPEASYGASYFGGSDEDYDVVKSAGSSGGYTTEATDGNLTAWNSLYAIMRSAGEFANHDNYLEALGLNPDGTVNPALPTLLDPVNLIDYMITTYFTSNKDGPGGSFTRPRNNNWFGIYNRQNPDGFKFFVHDFEHSMDTGNAVTGQYNIVSPLYTADPGRPLNENDIQYFNPHWLHEKLMANTEYRQMFIDRVQMHFFNGGALSEAAVLARLDARAAEIDLAIIAESARWGDSKTGNPFDKNDWLNAMTTTRNWLLGRQDVVIGQLSDVGWWPSAAAPQFRVNGSPQHGGQIDDQALLTLFAAGATSTTTIFDFGSTWKYLDDGSDQGAAWRAPGFNDDAWAQGPGQLGFGDGDEATVVGFVDADPGTSGVQKNATTYFRRTFNISDAASIEGLVIDITYDDAAIVYVNGTEVGRPGLPAGDIAFDFYTGSAIEETTTTISIDPSLFAEGANTIAVEIHQANTGSSDISFDMRLSAEQFSPGGDPIYYTTDGGDPRMDGGAVDPGAVLYGGAPFTLADSATLSARTLVGGEWSPLVSALFRVNTPAAAGNLAVAELNYHPTAPTTAELIADPALTDEDFEFIELVNIGAERIDLFGVQIIDGIQFDFTDSDAPTLGPGQRVVLVKNQAAFNIRYGGGADIAGQYIGSLNNAGETITIVGALQQQILSFTYGDGGAWPGRADGDGSSLEVIDPAGDLNDPDNWRSSSEYNGSPGVLGLGPDNRIVINEVLSHTDPPQFDSIELFNTTAGPIDIGGWFLSDSAGDYARFRIPDGTVIAAGGYLVFDEDDFNASGGVDPKDFGLDGAHGDEIYLLQADPATLALQRFVDVVDFGAQANGESWGRFPNGQGPLVPMQALTLGAANSDPRVGPLVFSEVMYNPPDPGGLPAGVSVDDLEFVEVFNPTGSAVDMTGWRIRGGVDFDFAPGFVLGAGGVIVILKFDPGDAANADKLAAFRAAYGLDETTLLIGGYGGQLDNGGEKVQLQRPDEPPVEEPTFVPHLFEDEIDYDDEAPWPASPDGGGDALHRAATDGFGHDAANWSAAAPSPGAPFAPADTTPPVIIEVRIAGGAWSPQFLDAADPGRGVAYTIPTGSAAQLASLPWININQISVVFSEDVAISLDQSMLLGVNVADYSGQVSGFSYDDMTFTATWTLAAPLAVDKLRLAVSDQVQDLAGNALDGEWTDGASTQSGDGAAGGMFAFRLNVLPGDSTRNGLVAAEDALATIGKTISLPGSPSYDVFSDVTGNGLIAAEDTLATIARTISLLPAGEPDLPAARTSGLAPQEAPAIATPEPAGALAQPGAAAIDPLFALGAAWVTDDNEPSPPRSVADFWRDVLRMDAEQTEDASVGASEEGR